MFDGDSTSPAPPDGRLSTQFTTPRGASGRVDAGTVRPLGEVGTHPHHGISRNCRVADEQS